MTSNDMLSYELDELYKGCISNAAKLTTSVTSKLADKISAFVLEMRIKKDNPLTHEVLYNEEIVRKLASRGMSKPANYDELAKWVTAVINNYELETTNLRRVINKTKSAYSNILVGVKNMLTRDAIAAAAQVDIN